jgi:hypothetical protein
MLSSASVRRRFSLALPLVIVASAASAASGCRPKEKPEVAICLEEVAGKEAAEFKSGDVPAEVWFAILMRNYNRKTSQVAKPVRDCSGREVGPVGDEAMEACLRGGSQATALPEQPLTQDDLFIVPTEEGQLLVWIQLEKFDNGEAMGPIALADWTKRGVAVRAIGTLRAQANRASMRLEPMGENRVLVIESQLCDPDNPKKCNRVMRFLPMAGDRFIERPLVAEDGTCLGVPEIELYRDSKVELGNRIRTFEMGRAIDFTDGNVVISEQVTIKDTDPSQPDAPPVVFRQAHVQRPLVLGERGIVTQEGLWDRMVSEHGSVAVRPDATPEGE